MVLENPGHFAASDTLDQGVLVRLIIENAVNAHPPEFLDDAHDDDAH